MYLSRSYFPIRISHLNIVFAISAPSANVRSKSHTHSSCSILITNQSRKMSIQPPPLCPRRSRSTRQSPILIASTTEATSSLTPSQVFRLSLFSGAVAGFTVDAALFPLDTLKTRLQLALPTGSASRSTASIFSGLYAGFGPAVLASAPAAAAFFGVYDYVKRILAPYDKQNKYTPFFHIFAAAAGDVASSTVRAPFEVVKQRMQSGLHATATGAVKSTLQQEGALGFFRGYFSLVLRDLPFDAIQFPLYEYLKVVAKNRLDGKRDLYTWETSVCGSIAGGISAAVTTPIDVVKTRLMTQNPANIKYKGLVHGLRTVVNEEGVAALSKGIVPRVIWISLGGAIFFGAYEAAKKILFPVVVPEKAKEQPKLA